MKVKIIKGTNQIGGCITEISTKNTKIIIDFGEDLDDSNQSFELNGLTKGKSIYDAVFITHSHGDHMGLIDKINKDILIYTEELSLKIYNTTCDFCNKEKLSRQVNTFSIDKYPNKIKIGDITITPYRVDHSSYNSCMYLIEAEGKRILHTGDFRFHGRKGQETITNLEKIGKVDLLITEGTSLSRNIQENEREKSIELKSYEYMKDYDQVFLMQSSTNIDRTVSFVRAALKSGKNFILDVFTYSLNKIINMNINVDYKRIFVWKPIRYYNKDTEFKEKYMDFKTDSFFGRKYAMQVKVSMLDDIEKLNEKGLITNACLIYSMWDGYIEKENKLKDFISKLEKMNIKFIKLHTSGHADIESMKKLNDIVNPNSTIIIHTESKETGKDIFNNVEDISDSEEIII